MLMYSHSQAGQAEILQILLRGVQAGKVHIDTEVRQQVQEYISAHPVCADMTTPAAAPLAASQ
jgi:hypothetical protein